MRQFKLDTIDDGEKILSYKEYLVICGKHPWIFLKDGTYIAKLKAIRNAYEMVFLPNDTVLIDGGADRSYHLVSLENGEILWSYAKKGKRELSPIKFVVSPNKQTIYYIYYNKAQLCADEIDPEKRSVTTYPITNVKGAIMRGYCEDDGCLFLMRSLVKTEIGLDGEEIRRKMYDIFMWSPEKDNIEWIQQWADENAFAAPVECFGRKYVLLNNLTAVNIATNETVNLLESSNEFKIPRGGFLVSDYDQNNALLSIRFIFDGSTIIIDCLKKKVVAQYYPPSNDLNGGKLIDGEFWIGTFNGIVKRPFPFMESIPTHKGIRSSST